MKTFRIIITKIIFIIGVLLIVDAGFTATMTNLNVGTLLTFLMGAFLAVCGIGHNKIGQLTQQGIGRVIKYIAMIGICFVLAMIVFLASYGMKNTVNGQEDAVIVLGAAVHGDQVSRSLSHRLDTAAEYAQQNPNAILVVSGGKGAQENVTEASAMEAYLIEKGIPKQRILKEEKATSTYENFKYSKAILDEKLGSDYTCVYVTNDYHTYRAGEIAKDAGLSATRAGAYTDWWYTPPSYLREILAVIKFWVFRE